MPVVSKKPIEGLAELKKTIAGLPDKLQKKVIEGATRDGANELKKAYRENIPPNYKTLKKSVKVIKLRKKKRTETKFTVTPTRGKRAKYDAWYAHIVERGAQPHEITPDVAKVLRIPEGYYNSAEGIKWGGGFSKKVEHSGIRPTRAFYRAFKQQGRILNAIVRGGYKRFSRAKLK